jgi:hypothetical protein
VFLLISSFFTRMPSSFIDINSLDFRIFLTLNGNPDKFIIIPPKFFPYQKIEIKLKSFLINSQTWIENNSEFMKISKNTIKFSLSNYLDPIVLES